jgi:hypothetical protein
MLALASVSEPLQSLQQQQKHIYSLGLVLDHKDRINFAKDEFRKMKKKGGAGRCRAVAECESGVRSRKRIQLDQPNTHQYTHTYKLHIYSDISHWNDTEPIHDWK